MNLLDLPPDEPTTAKELRARTRRVLALRKESRRPQPVTVEVAPPPVEEAQAPPQPPPTRAPQPLPPFEIPRSFIINGSPKPSIKYIICVTAEYFGISVRDLIGKDKFKHLVNPRHVAMYLARKLTDRSWPDIARRFNDHDHTTVLHAFRRISAMINSDEAITAAVIEIERKVLE